MSFIQMQLTLTVATITNQQRQSTEVKTQPDAVISKSRLIQSHLSILQFETQRACVH